MADKKKEKRQGELVMKSLEGFARLERYKDLGYVVVFQGKKELFWMTYESFEKVYADFSEIYKIQNKKLLKVTSTKADGKNASNDSQTDLGETRSK